MEELDALWLLLRIFVNRYFQIGSSTAQRAILGCGSRHFNAKMGIEYSGGAGFVARGAQPVMTQAIRG